MRKIIKIAVVIGLLYLASNDIARVGTAARVLNGATFDIASALSTRVGGTSREAAAGMAASMGAEKGITVYQYDHDERAVDVWTSINVDGTYVAGPVAALMKKTPLKQVFKTPLVLRDHEKSLIIR